MNFELTPLPFSYDALDPFISERTLKIHHQKHHGGYVKKLDKALADDALRSESLEDIVRSSKGSTFNLAAQVWNHAFYWNSLAPTSSPLADGTLKSLINASFGDMAGFEKAFSAEASNEFGSGWAWLAFNPQADQLEVFSTTDAVTPITTGLVPLLTLDVWEHAYYLDYQNERGRYIKTFLANHINWEFAKKNLRG